MVYSYLSHSVTENSIRRLFSVSKRKTTAVLIYGHTHRALIHRAGRRWVVNPGAAGPRRFDLIPSVARLTMREGEVADVRIIPLT
ncbi:MAG: hypothetical protein GEV06_03230 [Luteitalea sp.]|nr:hypothetical protein [Luteitalea sp.]